MSFRKFTLKHLTLISVAPAIIVWSVLTVLTYKNVIDVGYSGIAAVLVMLLTSVGLKKYHSSYMKKAERSLYYDCDPYPTIEEVKLYIECAGKKINKFGLLSTLGMMLALVGDYENAEKTFLSIENAEGVKLTDAAHAGVCYNMAALYCAMNMPEHAMDSYDRAKDYFEKTPEAFRTRMEFNGPTDAEIECYKGNHNAALGILANIIPSNALQEITKTFTLAKVHYISGDRDTALEEFDSIASAEGRLACIKESAEIAKAIRGL